MDPKTAMEMARGLGNDSGNQYLLYILAFFCISVVLYLVREYVSTHKTMIIVLRTNTKLMRRICKHLQRSEDAARPDDRTLPRHPSSSGSVQRVVPINFGGEH